MPPRKDDKKKVKVEGVTIEDIPWLVLQKFVLDLLGKVMIERGERSRAQVEMDLIRTAWHCAEKDLEEAKAKHRRLLTDRDNVFNEFVQPIKEMHQEMKWLNYTIGPDIESKEVQLETKLKGLRKAWDEEVLTGLWEAKVDVKEEVLRRNNELFQLYDSEEVRLAAELEQYKKELDRMLQERLKDMGLGKEWTEREIKRLHMLEMLRVQEERNLLIKDLETKHKVVFDRTKRFFKETTDGDVSLIITLFEEMIKVKKHVKWLRKEVIRMKGVISKRSCEVENANRAMRATENKVKFLRKEKHSLDLMKGTNKQHHIVLKEKLGRISDLETQLNGLWEERNKLIESTQNVCQEQRNLKSEFNCLQIEKVFGKELFNLEYWNQKINDFAELGPEFDGQVVNMLKLMNEEEKVFKMFPLMATKEMKAQSDLLDTIEQAAVQLQIDPMPDLMRIKCDLLKYKGGPGGIFAGYHDCHG